jgi:hypothetical protein
VDHSPRRVEFRFGGMLGDETLSNIAATNFEPRLSLAGAPTYDELCQAFPEAEDEPIIAAIPNVASEDEDVFGWDEP